MLVNSIYLYIFRATEKNHRSSFVIVSLFATWSFKTEMKGVYMFIYMMYIPQSNWLDYLPFISFSFLLLYFRLSIYNICGNRYIYIRKMKIIVLKNIDDV